MTKIRSYFKRALPRSLFGRSLVIIVAPLLFVQLISTYVFFDRHWESVTRQFSDNIAGQVHLLTTLWEEGRLPTEDLKTYAQQAFGMGVSFPSSSFQEEKPSFDSDDRWLGMDFLAYSLADHLKRPFSLNLQKETLQISLLTSQGGVEFSFPLKRLVVKTTSIYILWSLGTSIFFLFIAILFMRNQIRPLRRLAEAAENFGKGRDVGSFKPEGSIEVRKAGTAFIVMKERIQRHLLQRTEILAGVSHDLRTPLTRMSLQLAMFPTSPEVQELQKDLKEMEHMVQVYLDFTRGEAQENQEITAILPFLKNIVGSFKNLSVTFVVEPSFSPNLAIPLKLCSLSRCFSNILSNAERYSQGIVRISLGQRNQSLYVTVEDKGPGIPEEERKLVFKPFYRREPSRNQETGGVGLGLTIARDSVRAHGGSITLGASPDLGGLKVQIRLPL